MQRRGMHAIASVRDANRGFPYLLGSGRLIVEDFIMLGAAMVTLNLNHAAIGK